MQLGEKTWKEAAGLSDRIVVVPIGSMEQHGQHLPLLTDTMIGEEIVRRAREQPVAEAVFLPPLWLGCSPHHLEFPGTVSLSSDTYIRVVEDVAESLIRGGFRRILFFNSHAGNMSPVSIAIANVQLRHASALPNLWLMSASWFVIAASAIADIEGLTQEKIAHACEWETSQILAVRADLVKAERPAARFDLLVEGKPSRFTSPDYSFIGLAEVPRRIDQNSASGAFGWPELASIEKGEQLFEAAGRELAGLLREFAAWPAEVTPQMSVGF